ncbi:MAG TPA: acyl-CoA dehydrogenase family protein [Pseudomonadota bacterium]|nr:acyl-CoA dehydrogenase family protein [Pseudomonadota bacterium]
MNFELSDDEKALQKTVRDFAQAEIAPHCRKWDNESHFPTELVPKLGQLGLLGMTIDEEYGGSAMSMQEIALVIEELAAVDGSVAITVASHNGLCSGHISLFGNEDQKRRYLPDLASGKKLGAWGLTEPGSGSDAAGAKTKATRLPDGSWSLSGQKTFITQGSVGSVAVILAVTSPEKKQRGITSFIVEHGTPGFSASRRIEKMGLHASDTAELTLDDVRVADSQRLGDIDQGFLDTLRILDKGRITIGAMALGLGAGAMEAAIRYAKERRQFGKTLSEFQAIQNMIAQSGMELDAARLLLRRAAWMFDQGMRFSMQASMGKLYAAQAAMRACSVAVQIHGGYGYTREFPVEKAMRDAKLCEIGEGTNEIQRLVISRELLGKGQLVVPGLL